jgi:hypothetical protein
MMAVFSSAPSSKDGDIPAANFLESGNIPAKMSKEVPESECLRLLWEDAFVVGTSGDLALLKPIQNTHCGLESLKI